MAGKSKSKRKGFVHNDVVNGDVDQLHEESNKAHEEETDSDCLANLEVL